MKLFSGFSKKEKKINRVLGIVFIFAFISSLINAILTPEKTELEHVTSKIQGIECKKDKATETLTLVISGELGEELDFHTNTECSYLDTSELHGKTTQVYFTNSGLDKRIAYEIEVGGHLLLSYEKTANSRKLMPLGVIFVFGLPWLGWLFVRVIMSQKL